MSQQRDPEKLKAKLFDFAKDFPFFSLVGFELVDFGPGWSKTRIALRDDLKNPNGVMHGGMIATLMDAGITQAMLMTDIYQQVRDTRGFMTTVDLRVKYLRPMTSGVATCEAEIPHMGRRVCHASAVVKNDDGKVVATGDSILMITLGDRKPEP
ncbi:MAG: PaaI family thioesterase [Myxococcales bacterium]|jgi:acyl-CoA thioesterase